MRPGGLTKEGQSQPCKPGAALPLPPLLTHLSRRFGRGICPMAFKLPDEPLYWRGAICLMIGFFIVLGPHIMRSAMWIDLLGNSQPVGWFAVVLGFVLVWRGWRTQSRKK